MIQFNRPEKPKSLVENADNWTHELINELKTLSYSKVKDSIKNRYRQDDIKEALETMQDNLCCYCESEIEKATTFSHIEHRKPKSLFPEESFNWNNLFLICPVCNTNKSNQWDEENEILDCCIDLPKEHIDYNNSILDSKTKRGLTTINHCDLNRKSLIEARNKVLIKLLHIIENFKKNNPQIDQEKSKTIFRERICNLNLEYPSLCLYYIDIIY